MEIKELNKIPGIDQNKKLNKAYTQFNKLLIELRQRELSNKIVSAINEDIDQVNAVSSSEKAWKKEIAKAQSSIIKLLEKEIKLVVKNHYRNTWLALGMAAFGLPIGVVFGTMQDNMGLLGVGLPIGMIIGMVVGSGMDKKAFEEGRQLDLEIED